MRADIKEKKQKSIKKQEVSNKILPLAFLLSAFIISAVSRCVCHAAWGRFAIRVSVICVLRDREFNTLCALPSLVVCDIFGALCRFTDLCYSFVRLYIFSSCSLFWCVRCSLYCLLLFLQCVLFGLLTCDVGLICTVLCDMYCALRYVLRFAMCAVLCDVCCAL